MLILNEHEFVRLVDSLIEDGDGIVIDTETAPFSTHAPDAKLLLVSIFSQKQGSISVPISHPDNVWTTEQYTAVFEAMQRLLTSELPKVGHNIKFDLHWLKWQFKCPVNRVVADTMLLARLYDENVASKKHGGVGSGLKELCQWYLGCEDWEAELKDIKKKWCKARKVKLGDFTYDKFDLDTLALYAEKDVLYTYQLLEFLNGGIHKQQREIHNKISMPATLCFVDIEEAGMKIDKAALELCRVSLTDQIGRDTEELNGFPESHGVNVNSPKQLQELFYGKLALPQQFNPKTNKLTTDKAALNVLGQFHHVPKLVQRIRESNKLLGTYVEGMGRAATKTGRIHPQFNIEEAATGRTSSSAPNFQNLNHYIKKVFVPEPGYKYIQADFSQLELRILAVLASDPEMTKAFVAGADIHAETAALIYSTQVSEVTEKQRKVGKTMGFAIVYGMSSKSLALKLGISEQEADTIYRAYMRKKPAIANYINSTKLFAQTHGFVVSPFGRIRHLPDAKRGDGHALRQAVNSPIQSCGSDITLLSIVELHKELKAWGLDARIVCSVHDSIVLEVAEQSIDETIMRIKKICENTKRLGWWQSAIPLKVDISVGVNLGELAEIEFADTDADDEEGSDFSIGE